MKPANKQVQLTNRQDDSCGVIKENSPDKSRYVLARSTAESAKRPCYTTEICNTISIILCDTEITNNFITPFLSYFHRQELL